MNDSNIVLDIKCKDDIKKISPETKYINLSLFDIDYDVIDYFLINGKDFYYSDLDNSNKYIYSSYDYFKKGESIIQNIIDEMPVRLNKLETIRYIYISLGKIISKDINSISHSIEFDSYNINNNIWSSLSCHYISNKLTALLFKYICNKNNIKCDVVNNDGTYSNIVYYDDNELEVNLYEDISNIQGGFKTKFFDEYNDNADIDKKIYYIKDRYKDDIVSDFFKYLNINKKLDIEDLLNKISVLFNIKRIGVCELATIYKSIFKKYLSNIKIKIINFFFYNKSNQKEHFLIFNYKECNYYYNYDLNLFERVKEEVLNKNIDSGYMSYYIDENGEELCCY